MPPKSDNKDALIAQLRDDKAQLLEVIKQQDAIQAKDTAIARLRDLITTQDAKHQMAMNKQREIVVKLRDALAKYTALDLQAYLEEAEERRALKEEEQLREQFRNQMNNETMLHKLGEIYKGRYAGVPLWKFITFPFSSLWQSWASNPYHLHAIWYLLMLFLILGWAIGSTVVGYYESEGEKDCSLRLAKLWRGILGSIPPMVQYILFLFPPLFVQF